MMCFRCFNHKFRCNVAGLALSGKELRRPETAWVQIRPEAAPARTPENLDAVRLFSGHVQNPSRDLRDVTHGVNHLLVLDAGGGDEGYRALIGVAKLC